VFIDPFMDNWPIITDDNYPKANIVKGKTSQMVRKCIVSFWEKGITPVIGGFIGKDVNGNVTLLGRGGSDVTAFVIGEALKADEIVIVTDVEGVLSADPRRLSSKVSVLEDITAEEMQILAENGAKVLHPEAVKYKPPHIKAKVIHYKYGDLSVKGTQIRGSIQEQVALLNGKLSMITIVGESFLETAGLLKRIVTPLADDGISIYSFALGDKYISLYVKAEDEAKSYRLLHDMVLSEKQLKSVTITSDIAMFMVASRMFIDTPGIIQRLTLPLSERNINIIEMVTIKTDIFIFVKWEYREQVYKLLSDEMERIKEDGTTFK
ncbi:MAG: ACT domain-containing protein, partial [Synergistetes bacterium]|nr:ACT domain-containing protein [Synergistota bacterium]